MPMSGEVVAIVERLFKALVFVPCLALIAWWVFSSWLDRTLKASEAAIGLALLAGAFLLGVVSIISGGWGFLGVLAFLYLALLGLGAWEYTYWRRHEKQHLLDEVKKYEQAISLDPRNAAAHSFLGKTHLALRQIDEAAAALEQALALDPESHTDRSLLRQVREIQARMEAQRQTPKR